MEHIREDTAGVQPPCVGTPPVAVAAHSDGGDVAAPVVFHTPLCLYSVGGVAPQRPAPGCLRIRGMCSCARAGVHAGGGGAAAPGPAAAASRRHCLRS